MLEYHERQFAGGKFYTITGCDRAFSEAEVEEALRLWDNEKERERIRTDLHKQFVKEMREWVEKHPHIQAVELDCSPTGYQIKNEFTYDDLTEEEKRYVPDPNQPAKTVITLDEMIETLKRVFPNSPSEYIKSLAKSLLEEQEKWGV